MFWRLSKKEFGTFVLFIGVSGWKEIELFMEV